MAQPIADPGDISAPERTKVAHALASPARARLLTILRSGPARSAAALAEAVELHLNTVRSHLEIMVDAGLITRASEAANGPGRPKVLYRALATSNLGPDLATADRPNPGNGQPNHGYRVLAEVLTNHLAGEHDASQVAEYAGRRWAASLKQAGWQDREHSPQEALTLLVSLLKDLGFDPATEPLGDRIYLRTCPFAELARNSSAVVCGVHTGLIRGAVDQLNTSLTVRSVRPFRQGGICLIELG